MDLVQEVDTSKDVLCRPSAYANTIGQTIFITIKKSIFFIFNLSNVHYSIISQLPVTKFTPYFAVFSFNRFFFLEKPSLASSLDALTTTCRMFCYILKAQLFLQPQFVLYRERCRVRPLECYQLLVVCCVTYLRLNCFYSLCFYFTENGVEFVLWNATNYLWYVVLHT